MKTILSFTIANWRFYSALLIGLTCLNIWPDVVGHGSAFEASAAVVQALTNGRVFFSLGLGSGAFVFAVCSRRLAGWGDRLLVPLGVLSMVVTLGYALCPELAGMVGIAVAASCAYGVGFGYGCLLVLLLCQLVQLRDVGTAAVLGATSLLLKTVLDLVLGLLPATVQVGSAVAAPMLCVVSLLLAGRVSTQGGVPLDLAEIPKCNDDNQRILLVILIMNAVLHAVTRAMSQLGFWGNGYLIGGLPSFGLLVSAAILIVAVVYTMASESNSNMLVRFLPAFFTLLGGFFVLDPQIAGMLGLSAEVSSILTTVIELYAHTLYWVIIVTAVRKLPMHPYRAVGIAATVMCVTAASLGLLFQAWSNTLEPVPVNSMIIMVAMYVFAAVIVVLFRGPQGTDGIVGDGGTDGERLRVMAERAGLSPRETEVFILLAEGRDRNYIKGELFISDATVKTHSRHIYAKLGVRTKQELISVVRGGGEGV